MLNLHWNQIEPNPLNKLVRGEIDESELRGLAQSIKSKGVIQPLTVIAVNGHYKIQTGERRWRAAKSLGNEAPLLPCVVVEPGGEVEELLAMGIENLQRRNLPPVTEARYYQALVDRGLTIAQIAKQVGRSAEHIGRRLDLLDLPAEVCDAIEAKRFPVTQAQTIKGLPEKLMIEVVNKTAGKNGKTIEKVVALVKARSKRVQSPRAEQPPKGESEVEVLRRLSAEVAAQLWHGAKLMDRLAEALADEGNFELAEEAGDWAGQVMGSMRSAVSNGKRS